MKDNVIDQAIAIVESKDFPTGKLRAGEIAKGIAIGAIRKYTGNITSPHKIAEKAVAAAMPFAEKQVAEEQAREAEAEAIRAEAARVKAEAEAKAKAEAIRVAEAEAEAAESRLQVKQAILSKGPFDLARNAIAEAFSPIVGMADAKKRIGENLLANLASNGDLPLLSPIILAPAGTGKTRLALAALQAHEAATGSLTLSVLPSEIRKQGDQWDHLVGFLTRHEESRKVIFIDECHELFQSGRTVQLAKVGSFAMAALDGNRPDVQEIKLSDELTIPWDRSKHCLIMATNFPGKCPEAMAGKAGRAPQLPLPLYAEDESAEIARLMLERHGIRANHESLKALARVARGSARPLEHLTAQLRVIAILAGKATVSKADILQAMIACGLFPLGFNTAEVDALRFYQSPATVATLQARFPSLDHGTCRAFMGHAIGHGLICRVAGGFTLTDKGRRYFVDVPAMGFPLAPLD